jgi:hypothetical protein
MFCAFDSKPNIVRLYGTGRVVPAGDPEYPELLASFPAAPETHGVRSIIDVAVQRVSDSCGYAVPLMSYEGDRDLLVQWSSRRSDDDLAEYRKAKNTASIDGLPAFD